MHSKDTTESANLHEENRESVFWSCGVDEASNANLAGFYSSAWA